ncbi:hypothetical protein ALC56_02641 [Trachymyrmex septentrionalis]|uniref:Uncharacterized protein n=1 Tax=Trachymyrmex septentrionalis TaxID=34720 RepID=A0A195FSG1_9HYME|nr:hypothetical protein ALC56_02641 [Trachymyrmex septentrionalis]
MVSRPYQKIESRGWRGSYDLINNRDSAPLDLRASRLADDLTLREEREKKSTAGKCFLTWIGGGRRRLGARVEIEPHDFLRDVGVQGRNPAY